MNITWLQFFVFIGIALVMYYVAIAIVFYREELLTLSSRGIRTKMKTAKPVLNANGYPTKDIQTDPNYEDNTIVEDFIEKKIIREEDFIVDNTALTDEYIQKLLNGHNAEGDNMFAGLPGEEGSLAGMDFMNEENELGDAQNLDGSSPDSLQNLADHKLDDASLDSILATLRQEHNTDIVTTETATSVEHLNTISEDHNSEDLDSIILAGLSDAVQSNNNTDQANVTNIANNKISLAKHKAELAKNKQSKLPIDKDLYASLPEPIDSEAQAKDKLDHKSSEGGVADSGGGDDGAPHVSSDNGSIASDSGSREILAAASTTTMNDNHQSEYTSNGSREILAAASTTMNDNNTQHIANVHDASIIALNADPPGGADMKVENDSIMHLVPGGGSLG
jgi:hypothetical protein